MVILFMKYIVSFFMLSLFFSCAAMSQENSEYENAYKSYEDGNIDESYIFLKRSLSDTPNHLPSKILMAEVLALSGYFDDAKMEFEESLQAGADPNLVIESYSRVLLLLRSYNDLYDVDDSQLTPNNRAFLFAAQALGHLRENNYDEAERLYESAIAMAPQNPVIVTAVIRFYLVTDNLISAKTLLDEAVVAHNDVAEVYQLLGKYYDTVNNTSAQITALNKGLSLSSNHPGILRDLVTAYTSIGEYQKAKTAIEDTLNDSPEDPMAQFLYSWVTAELGESDVSKTTLDSLVNSLSLIETDRLEESDGMLLISAMANFAANNIEISRGQFEKYMKQNPNNFNAAMLLVDVYSQEQSFVAAANLLSRYEEKVKSEPTLILRLCQLYTSANQNHKCDLLLRQTKQRFETDESYLQAQSMLYAARGKLDLAIESLEKLSDSNFSALVQKSVLAIRANNLDQAEVYVEELLKELPDNPDFLNLKASIYNQRGELAQAQALYQEVLDKRPEHFSATFNLVGIYLAQGQLSVAKALATQLIEKQPLNADVLLLHGRIHTQLGDFATAQNSLSSANSLKSNDMRIGNALIELYVAQEEPENALSVVNRLLKLDLANTRLLRQRASINYQLGNEKESINDLKILFGLVSTNSDALFELANLQSQYGDIEGAMRSLKQAATITPNDFFITRNLARVAMVHNDKTVLSETLGWLSDNFPNQADVLLLKAQDAQANSELQLASELFLQTVVLQRDLAPALIGSYQLAINDINTAEFERVFGNLAQDPFSNTFSVHLFADYLLLNKRYEAAKQNYISISNAVNYVALPMVLNNLANIYVIEGKIDAAYNFAKQAHERLQNNPNILNTLGWIYAQQGKFDSALDLLRKAYAMNAQDPNIRYHLAYTLYKLGRTEESKRELKIVLDGFNDFEKRSDALGLQKELNNLETETGEI